ncbi:alpha/beta hydrolase fold [Filimonas lacunae]|nr:alpha/beta hydrolase fold [Filimonas lacunae]
MNTVDTTPGRTAEVNGLQIYYELHGCGTPLVLLHGGGSTITSTFGRILPLLAALHTVVAVELQAHGRTPDRGRALSFEQDADDVAALLQHLQITQAAVMGFSNGGTTALQLAIRHPQQVSKLVLASATYKRNGMQPGFFEGMQQAALEHMPALLQKAFLEVNPDAAALQTMFNRDVERMLAFTDIAEDAIKSIAAPALVINGDAEVVCAGHALELSRTLPHAQLAILPGGHGDYIGELCSLQQTAIPALVTEMIKMFLKA